MASSVKPWEETWYWDPEKQGVYSTSKDEFGIRRKIVETDSEVYPPHGLDRSLVCAAPDMARVLLAILADVEAALADDGLDDIAGRHAALIEVALRKAGVR